MGWSRVLLLTTIPANMVTPIYASRLKGVAVRVREPTTPMAATATEHMTIRGSLRDLSCHDHDGINEKHAKYKQKFWSGERLGQCAVVPRPARQDDHRHDGQKDFLHELAGQSLPQVRQRSKRYRPTRWTRSNSATAFT